MRLNFSKNFSRDYDKLPESIKGQVDKALTLLEANLQHPSLRTHKRKGEKGVWQARATRSYRLFFKMEGDLIRLIAVCSHEK